MIEKALLDSLISYAKALTNARSFADYYAELAVGEFLENGGCFSDPEYARHRLYEAFHRVWRGAQACQLRNGRAAVNGDGVALGETSGAAEPWRRAARLLVSRERFSPAEVAGILNRPVPTIEAWLEQEGVAVRRVQKLPAELSLGTDATDPLPALRLLPPSPAEIGLRPALRPAAPARKMEAAALR